jgi:hypothetical protein
MCISVLNISWTRLLPANTRGRDLRVKPGVSRPALALEKKLKFTMLELSTMLPDAGDGTHKRRKVVGQDDSTVSRRVPQIFTPFRSIGIVSNHIPPALQVRGKSYQVTTCVGKSFQTYDVRWPCCSTDFSVQSSI